MLVKTHCPTPLWLEGATHQSQLFCGAQLLQELKVEHCEATDAAAVAAASARRAPRMPAAAPQQAIGTKSSFSGNKKKKEKKC